MRELCKVAQVSRSGFYSYISRIPSTLTDDEELIINLFHKHKEKFGYRRLKMEIWRSFKRNMNTKKIRRIKKKFNLMSRVRRKSVYRRGFLKGEEHAVAANLVRRNFSPPEDVMVLSTDVTELRYRYGQKAYLSAIKDLRTKEIVHHKVSTSLSLDLVLEGLPKLLSSLSDETVIVHSDQGAQYTSGPFRRTLEHCGVWQSMSRKGNCLDNAPIESFFGHLKDEVDLKDCKSFEEVRNIVGRYIHYYNNDRPQWNLKQKTPAEARVKL